MEHITLIAGMLLSFSSVLLFAAAMQPEPKPPQGTTRTIRSSDYVIYVRVGES